VTASTAELSVQVVTGSSSQLFTSIVVNCTEQVPPAAAASTLQPFLQQQRSGQTLQRSALLPPLIPAGGGRGQAMRGVVLVVEGLRPGMRYNCTAQALTAERRRSERSAPTLLQTLR
jgi:hypothetical protein